MANTVDFLFQLVDIFTNTTQSELSTGKDSLSYKKSWSWTDGAGASKSEAVWHDQRTISASSNEDIDLAGALTDMFGTTVTFTKLKAIVVFAHAANTNNVEVTRAGTNGVPFMLAAGDGMAIKPGGIFVLIDPSSGGYAVTAGTGDLINIANSAGDSGVTYDIILVGETS